MKFMNSKYYGKVILGLSLLIVFSFVLCACTSSNVSVEAAEDTPAVIDSSKEALYQEAKERYNSGDFEHAAELFSQLGDYEDSATMAKEALYQKAKACFDSGDYGQAAQLFVDLGDYLDSSEMAKRSSEYHWIPVVELSDEEKQTAISELCISDYSWEPHSIWSIVFRTCNGEHKVMFCEVFFYGEDNVYEVCDLFSGVHLFSYYDQGSGGYILEETTEFFDNAPYFDEAVILQINSMPMFTNWYSDFKINCDYELQKKYLKIAEDGIINNIFTMEEHAEIYVNLVPEQFRVTGADLGLVPN